MKTINASDFKAHCLTILDEVAETGMPVVITKRGHEVAQLFPFVPAGPTYSQHTLFGSVEVVGDITGPAVDPDDWDANRGVL